MTAGVEPATVEACEWAMVEGVASRALRLGAIVRIGGVGKSSRLEIVSLQEV